MNYLKKKKKSVWILVFQEITPGSSDYYKDIFLILFMK